VFVGIMPIIRNVLMLVYYYEPTFDMRYLVTCSHAVSILLYNVLFWVFMPFCHTVAYHFFALPVIMLIGGWIMIADSFSVLVGAI